MGLVMNRIVIATSALSILFLAALVVAQTQPPRKQAPRPLKDEIPKAALLTERGAELADRLKWLRRAQFNMGAKHPSLPEVRSQIEGVKEQLKAWAPAPNAKSIEGRDLKRVIPQLNDEDLRQLVLQLTEDVAILKRRVQTLEASR